MKYKSYIERFVIGSQSTNMHCFFYIHIYLVDLFLNISLFYLKVWVTEKEKWKKRKRERDYLIWFTLHMAIKAITGSVWSLEPEASWFPTGVQGPNAFVHCLLLSQVISKKLNWKWNSWDMHWCPSGMMGLEVEN